MNNIQRFLLLFIFWLTKCCYPLFAQDTIKYNNGGENLRIGNRIEILEDKAGLERIENIKNATGFIHSTQDVPNLQITASTFWIRIIVKNYTKEALAIELAYPTIDSVTLYTQKIDGNFDVVQTGEFVPIYKRAHKHQNYIFDLNLSENQVGTYYLRVNSSEQFQLPVRLGTIKSIDESLFNRDLVFGIYIGIIFVMFFYNLFLFFTVKDNTYLYYIAYILFVGFTQACLTGYASRFLYPNSYLLANFMMVFIPASVGIFAILFLQKFMQVRKFTPKLFYILIVIVFIYVFCIALGVLKQYRLAASVLQVNVGVLAIVVITIGIIIMRRGYRPAYYFMLAWSIFIISVIIFILRNFNILPYNNYTYYSMEIGSSIEVILLSFALADRINTYRKEREESQLEAQVALQENVRIIREQNVVLDQKVNERTNELKLANNDLNKALVDLKDAESQLVESEKMASLGQLTAGIAHEINNPINFVTSNVKPLNRDVRILLDAVETLGKLATDNLDIGVKHKMVEELKQEMDYDYLKLEIDQLLNGISEGATRTAEIVKGLRVFSRLDEDDIKRADLNEGLDSTLIIINNLLNNLIKVEKKYSNLPLIECYPGKLNQVFLNIISNALYAIKKKFGSTEGGVLTIKTYFDDKFVFISISDNGIGMDENTKKRLFEPFFTTKDVGEGTGLGLSIAYNTINKHNGLINVNTAIGVGTEFILKLPFIHN